MFSAFLLFGALLTAAPQALAAAPVGTPAATYPLAEACELHVWPTDKFNLTVGLNYPWHGSAYGYQSNIVSRELSPPPSLSREQQGETLRALPLPELFGMPAGRVVLHPEPLAHEDEIQPGRHADSQASCYGELVLKGIFIEDVFARPRSERVVALFLRFEGAGPGPRNRLATTATAVLALPGKKQMTDDNLDAAFADAFRDSVRKFAEYARRAPALP